MIYLALLLLPVSVISAITVQRIAGLVSHIPSLVIILWPIIIMIVLSNRLFVSHRILLAFFVLELLTFDRPLQ